MRTLLNAAFAFTLAGYATGLLMPPPDARLQGMRAEFAAFAPFQSTPALKLPHNG